MEDIDIALKHALGIRWAFMGPFEIMDLNAPDGIKDSFTRYRKGIQNLAKEQNSVPEYSEEYQEPLTYIFPWQTLCLQRTLLWPKQQLTAQTRCCCEAWLQEVLLKQYLLQQESKL